jgi:hypothetical protein
MLHPTDNQIHLNAVGGGELIRNLQNDKDRERGRRAHPPVISSYLGGVRKSFRTDSNRNIILSLSFSWFLDGDNYQCTMCVCLQINSRVATNHHVINYFKNVAKIQVEMSIFLINLK